MIIKNKSNFFNKLLLITSGILALSSLASYFYAKIYFHETIKQSLIIIPNSSQLELWVNPPIFVYRKYYFFHVQNPKEFLDGAKPSLIERGPYVYREILEKRNIEFINRTTIKYNPFMSLYFEPSFSIGNESDIITVLNVPFVSTVEKLSKENQNFPINFLSIKDIVSGYYDPLMDLAMMSYPEKISSNQFRSTGCFLFSPNFLILNFWIESYLN
ncbi:Scavenger receptor class B member [Brachionus plicatilis]|uniref:Scavenger receptor class B member 1 n=1 Tax=Brachionus plicatilis TaxID=10195 RepID=A0A3M7SG38_BRAPC|nr:Scavenger receptor class B member [Brachionus plicatilis]